MAGFPQIETTTVLPVTLPWSETFADHCFEGRPVLPAVAAMEILSGALEDPSGSIEVNTITNARFEKFLFLNGSQNERPVQIERTRKPNGDIEAILSTRHQGPSGGVRRTLVHAVVTFPWVQPVMASPPHVPDEAFLNGCESISAKQIYSELVPFGPAFQNLLGPLRLRDVGAAAFIQCPNLRLTLDSRLPGSPFVLDAAFHAACVWGQRYGGMVTFPVGFKYRKIFLPTQAGERYLAHVIPTQKEKGLCRFDLWIWDSKNRLVEGVTGLLMREVGQGR